MMQKILVVDDNEDILVILKNFLSLKGFEVLVSLSCNEAMQIFYNFKPQLVLLDINVGQEDGRVMCEQIKSEAEYKHIPVILISANTDGLQSYKNHGAYAGVEKPFNLVKLLETIQEALQEPLSQ
ncbi:MAG TPA: response regulator [Chitinophagaceae bacterium]|nr:response regulator [Chitinophagaceae bacterium]